VGRLTGIETVLLDLDGTVYVGSQVVPGAPEAVRWLRDQGLTVRFTTNTDSVTPAVLADRLTRLGLPAAEDELVTPVAVAARLFASAPEVSLGPKHLLVIAHVVPLEGADLTEGVGRLRRRLLAVPAIAAVEITPVERTSC
jgi:ribonucleotide monophosphatase NagD (HAD superfamily)